MWNQREGVKIDLRAHDQANTANGIIMRHFGCRRDRCLSIPTLSDAQQ